MLESEIEKKLRGEIKKIGGKAYKFVSPGNARSNGQNSFNAGGDYLFCRIEKAWWKIIEITNCSKEKNRKIRI